MSKIIYSGLESSGKSLKLAMEAVRIAERNGRWNKSAYMRAKGRKRPIVSNMTFTQPFVEYCKTLDVPIFYWEDLEELISYKEADIFIDEVGNYFDSRLWADLSLDVRKWLTQGAKSGIEIYGSAQDFAQVDKAFRRLCNELYLITKIIGSRRPAATKPPVKRIWGVCAMQQLDPQGYDEDKKKFVSGSLIPAIFFIERKYCEIFDTGQFMARSAPPKLKHIERLCELDACGIKKIQHV